MSCFTTMSAVTAANDLDLTKHVNFTSGMILGVDDFTQEFGYLAGRDRWLARDTIGYGTVSGLKITVEEDAEKGPRVMIEPGVAITPRGQFICVPAAQCAYLNQWLAANSDKLDDWVQSSETDVSSPPTSPPAGDELRLYVVLCYRECLTDNVPIPGEPCRSEDELTAASRIKDDFSLELRFESPKQPEEEKVREFVEWLRQIEIVESGLSTPLEDFIQAIRDEWLNPASPPVSSPPTVLQIFVDDVCEYMRTAFRLWVTELRNVLSERKTGCSVEMTGANKTEDCLLLAELVIPLEQLSPGWKVSDTEDTAINEDKRPFLLHLRMLQELLTCGFNRIEETTPIVSPPILSPPDSVPHDHTLDSLSDVATPAPSDGQLLIFRGSEWVNEDFPISSPPLPIALDDLSDVATPSPSEGQILIFRGGEWVAETIETGGGTAVHADLAGLNADDHPQYLLVNGSRALTGNLNLGNNRITDLSAGAANGEAVIFEQAIKQNDTAGGDLSGTYPNPTVTKLQGNGVSDSNPGIGDILVWNGTEWTPQQPQASETEPFIILPLATIQRIGRNIYEIWLNIDAPGNLAEVRELEAVRVFGESNTPTNFLTRIDVTITPTNFRNVFQARLESEQNYMRFTFNLSEIRVEFRNDVMSLDEYAEQNNIKFSGYQDKERGFATIFVRSPNLG